MTQQRRISGYIKKVPILAKLDPARLRGVVEQIQLEEFRRRQVVYMPGDPGESLFFVGTGRIKLSRVTSDGKELTIAYRETGDLFGEASLVEIRPRREMAESMERTAVLVLPAQAFADLVAQDAAMGFDLSKILCRRRRDLEDRIEDLVFRDVNSNLAELLLRLADEHGVEDRRGTLVAFKITHQEMANIIGSTRETVSLTLSQFKKRKLIDTEGRKVIVSDSEGLKALI